MLDRNFRRATDAAENVRVNDVDVPAFAVHGVHPACDDGGNHVTFAVFTHRLRLAERQQSCKHETRSA